MEITTLFTVIESDFYEIEQLISIMQASFISRFQNCIMRLFCVDPEKIEIPTESKIRRFNLRQVAIRSTHTSEKAAITVLRFPRMTPPVF